MLPRIDTVGRLLEPEVTSWPQRAIYEVRGTQHFLMYFFSSPSEVELQAIEHGVPEIGFLCAPDAEHPEAILFVYRFASPDSALPWQDNSYTWHLVPPPDRNALPSVEAGIHAGVMFYMVDAATGIIRFLRFFTVGPEFTQALHRAIRLQASQPLDLARHEQVMLGMYQRYPTSQALAEAPGVIRTRGGD